jgi:hypothetical protein
MLKNLAKDFIILTVIFALCGSAAAVSLGISPSMVDFKQVLKGGYAEKTATISTSSQQPLDISISAGGQIGSWLSTSENSFVLDPNSRKTIVIKVIPPADTPSGTYTGTVTAISKPSATSSGAMGAIIVTAVETQVTIEVTGDQVEKFEVSSVSTEDTEEGQPIQFDLKVDNQGNVKITPSIHLAILDKNGQTLKSLDYSQTEILPTRSEPILIKVTNDLPIGDYDAKITIAVGAQQVEKRVSFSVLERGSLRLQGELVSMQANKVWANVGDVIEVSAMFKNTGQLVAPSVLKGKAYLEDNLVEVLEGDEIDVPVGETAELKTYFTPKNPGRYKIVGWVYYSKKTTKESFIILNVQGSNVTAAQAPAAGTTQERTPDWMYGTGLALIVVLVAAIAYWLRRARK